MNASPNIILFKTQHQDNHTAEKLKLQTLLVNNMEGLALSQICGIQVLNPIMSCAILEPFN